MLEEARNLHRESQLRWDLIAAENSMGFHNLNCHCEEDDSLTANTFVRRGSLAFQKNEIATPGKLRRVRDDKEMG
jgi:formate-dependent nitrite reductase cytochrome c552 subunit